ncbi:hypothetical protein SAMN05192566_1245 [Methylophilus rhizosphaerae]|uniref:Uncharacterized protein n=1 Tax=Methylophilus rhizosphaerae TaxID=492660 RepID=A0A1G9BN82_9PROT|nr:hypothetical protein [Methylophilus rhizosphaerae]SDK40614.1 hypothetical protein SAMN05192566_1245 [Methylophilus rhizosphaerae]
MRRFRRQSHKSLFSKTKNFLEVVKYIVEILAILIAGAWAYSKYLKIEKPLEIRTASTGFLNWSRLPAKDICLASLGVTIKNIGTLPFVVNKVVIESWSIDDASLTSAQNYFSPVSDKNKKLLVRKEFVGADSTSLVGTYGVNEENATDFSFTVKYEPKSAVYFLATVTGPYVNIKEGRWGFACDVEAN